MCVFERPDPKKINNAIAGFKQYFRDLPSFYACRERESQKTLQRRFNTIITQLAIQTLSFLSPLAELRIAKAVNSQAFPCLVNGRPREFKRSLASIFLSNAQIPALQTHTVHTEIQRMSHYLRRLRVIPLPAPPLQTNTPFHGFDIEQCIKEGNYWLTKGEKDPTNPMKSKIYSVETLGRFLQFADAMPAKIFLCS